MPQFQLPYVHRTFPGQRIEAVDAAAARVAAESPGRHDHHQVVLAADLDERRAHVADAAREHRRLPLEFARQLVIGHHRGLRRLRSDDDQVAVDERVLCQRPPGQLPAAEVLPGVLLPDRLVRRRADREEVAEGTGGIDRVPIDCRCASRARMVEPARRGVGEVPEFLAGGEVQAAERVADGVVSIQQIDLAGGDRGAAVAGANGRRPEHLRTLPAARRAATPFPGTCRPAGVQGSQASPRRACR